jgi:hypothetical protein
VCLATKLRIVININHLINISLSRLRASSIFKNIRPTVPPRLYDTKSTMPGLTSASGVLGFLSDTEPELKVFALQTLNDDIDTLWTEVAGSVGQM